MRHRGRCRARGAVAVEFALVLPVLLLLVLGALDWGYYFFTEQIVTNAAREGARAGTLHDTDAQAIADATATAQSYLQGAHLNPSKARVQVQLMTYAPDVTSVRVQVSYTTGSLTGFAPIIVPGAANAEAEMRR